MDTSASIFVAGGDTLIGAAIVKRLQLQGHTNLVGTGSAEPSPTDPAALEAFFSQCRPQYVFVAAGKSGGIEANRRYPVDLMQNNLLTECHLFDCAHRYAVRRLLYLASSCCYPKLCPQPMRVESLLTGPLEPTNEAYAVAKIAGLKLCQAYREQYGADFLVGIPANVFGPGDDSSLENSHVVAALIRRLHEAKVSGASVVEIWGTGEARREFLYADDAAEACLFAMEHHRGEQPLNLGGGTEVSIRELAEQVRRTIGYQGALRFDPGKPDGMPFKSLDSTPLRNMGWQPTTSLAAGLRATYQWFLATQAQSGVEHGR